MAGWRYHKRKHVPGWKFSRKRVDNDQVQVKLCDDLIFQILLLLPTESLVKFQCVCKTWSIIINSPVFVKSQDGNSKSETLLVSKWSPYCKVGGYGFLHLKSAKYFKSSICDYKLRAVDSLNGLVLATTIDRRLLLLNPMTAKHILLLEHKTFTKHENCYMSCDHSYNLAFCDESKTYKVVHFFRRKADDIHYKCEILTIGPNRWRMVDLPSVFDLQKCNQVQGLFFGGLLYWFFYDRLVVMNVQDEKFTIKNMSNFKNNLYFTHRLMEIGGNLGIVLSKESSVVNFEVWFSDEANEIWTKKYDIRVCARFRCHVEPICYSRDAKEIIFFGISRNFTIEVYAYNLVKNELRLIYTLDMPIEKFIPHRNTLVWPQSLEVV